MIKDKIVRKIVVKEIKNNDIDALQDPEAKAIAKIKAILISEGYNDNETLKDLAILEGCVKASELLRIIFEAPSILQQLFELGELGKEATQRYMWGTITDSRVQKIKEFFADGKRDQSK